MQTGDARDSNEMPMHGRVAFVTGGAGGLGQAIAAGFAAQGAAVVVADLHARRRDVDEVARGLPRAMGVSLDVTDSGSIRSAVHDAVSTLGSVDVMVCNAGLNVRKPTLEVTEADWDAVLDVNLRGVFFSAQAGAAQMVEQGRGGKIVSIASIMGLVGSMSSGAAYCASKAGVVNLTRVLGVEWAKHNIQVNSVAPTFVRTSLTEGIFENVAFLQSVLDRTPNGKLATPESIADAVVFLASSKADMITGITLPVDGGWTAW
jgi:NAD(P)-dependent dehydrogenase (short-subunit alcohol dehydrogenase family)